MLTGSKLVAAVFEGHHPTSRAVQAILEAHGYAVTSFSERPADVVSTVQSVGPDVIVLELAMAGVTGLLVVGDLAVSAPGCAVILLSPFEALREPALRAGAWALVGPDLVGLNEALVACRRPPCATADPEMIPRPAAPAG